MTDEVDYTALQPGDMLAAVRDDAFKWATAFCQHAEKLGHHGIDHGWMIGWFANAIEHSGDVRRWARESAHLAAGEAGEVAAGDIELVAQWFYEEMRPFDQGDWRWPEHENDDGYRGERARVCLAPSDVQAKCRDNAKRLLGYIRRLDASPTPAATVPPAGAMDSGAIPANKFEALVKEVNADEGIEFGKGRVMSGVWDFDVLVHEICAAYENLRALGGPANG